MLSEEKKSWLAAVLKVPVEKMAPVDMIPRAKGEKYKDEEKKGGWRGGNIKSLQEATHMVTHHFDDKEREDNTASFEDGRAMLPGGDYAKGSHLYAVDPKTGEMVLSGGKAAIVRDIDQDGTATDRVKETTIPEGTKEVMKDRKGKRLELYHHTSMLQGEDVGGAGIVSFYGEGRILSVDNESGHYTPRFVQLLQTVELLMKQGALLDQTLVDHEGRTVSGRSAVYGLYQKVQPMLANLPKDRDRVAELLHKLDDPQITQKRVLKLAAAGDKIVKRVETVKEAMAVLGKMGIGPSMKIDNQATVGFISAEEGVDGLNFRQKATRKDMKVDEFLMGTGATGTGTNPSRGGLEDGDNEVGKEGGEEKGVNPYMATNYHAKPSMDGYMDIKSLRGDDSDVSDDDSDDKDEGEAPKLDTQDKVEVPVPQRKKVSHRDGEAKSDMLDELKDVVAKRRPERSKDKDKSVFTGEAPKVDEAKWMDDVIRLSLALNDVEDEDEDEEDEEDDLDDLDLSDDEGEGEGDGKDNGKGGVSGETYFDLLDENDKVSNQRSNYDQPSLRGGPSGTEAKKGKKKGGKTVQDSPYLMQVDDETPYKDTFVQMKDLDDD